MLLGNVSENETPVREAPRRRGMTSRRSTPGSPLPRGSPAARDPNVVSAPGAPAFQEGPAPASPEKGVGEPGPGATLPLEGDGALPDGRPTPTLLPPSSPAPRARRVKRGPKRAAPAPSGRAWPACGPEGVGVEKHTHTDRRIND